ncbi:MAG: hypothetical protein COA66_16030, partial [Arcobacter sp.]
MENLLKIIDANGIERIIDLSNIANIDINEDDTIIIKGFLSSEFNNNDLTIVFSDGKEVILNNVVTFLKEHNFNDTQIIIQNENNTESKTIDTFSELVRFNNPSSSNPFSNNFSSFNGSGIGGGGIGGGGEAEAGIVTIDNISDDDVINIIESHSVIILTGTATQGDISTGDIVYITIGLNEYTTTVGSDGTWSLHVLGSDLVISATFEVRVDSFNDEGTGVSSYVTSSHLIDLVANAKSDNNSVSEDGINAVVGNVLFNDFDVDYISNPGTRDLVYGTITLNVDGSYSYVLNNNVHELAQGETFQEVFAYEAKDNAGNVSAAVLTINIIGTNDAPLIVIGNTTVNEDSTEIIAKVSDIDGVIVDGTLTASHGTLMVNSIGEIIYIPNSGYFGTDSITISVEDNNGAITTKTFNVDVVEKADVKIDDLVVYEGAMAVFTVDITKSLANSTLNLNFSDASATENNDYKKDVYEYSLDAGNTWINVPSNNEIPLLSGGAFTVLIRVDIVDDRILEGKETFSLEVQVENSLGTISSATSNVEIINNSVNANDDEEDSFTNSSALNLKTSQELSTTNTHEYNSEVAGLDDGGYVVVWQGN